ncbi:MAG TPA: hypothetical protein VMM36_11800 [Opitutaceae bacterium]|nr:hypothetical protein [Opitutaceae bacterium]
MTRTRRRLLTHAILVPCIAALILFVYVLGVSPNENFRWSVSTGYTGLVLLSATLLLGPWNFLRRKPTPVSSDLRRDIGVWAALISIWHVFLGLQSHMIGKKWTYFFYHDNFGPVSDLRHDLFGWANHTGLLAALLALLLAMLSNDQSLRMLGATQWKRLQRTNYLLFGLTVLHTLFYQMIEKRIPVYVFALALIAAVVAGLQVVRMVGWRTKTVA